jgi:hypothetical protein
MQAYSVRRFPNKNKKVIFILGGWGNSLVLYLPLIKLFNSYGYYCIFYSFKKSCFTWEVVNTVNNFKTIKASVLNEITRLKKENYSSFSIFGTSLGSALAIFIANSSKDIARIILNLVGDDIAEIAWSWNVNRLWRLRFASFKKELIKKNMTRKKVKEIWQEIAPINNLTNFKNKKILVYLAKKDKIIPYGCGQKLIKEFKDRKLSFILCENNFFGHLSSAIYNLIRFNIYLNFLKN